MARTRRSIWTASAALGLGITHLLDGHPAQAKAPLEEARGLYEDSVIGTVWPWLQQSVTLAAWRALDEAIEALWSGVELFPE